MEGKLEKMEKDYSEEGVVKIAEATKLAEQNMLEKAIEEVLLPFEKQTRLACDMVTTSNVLCTVVELCFKAKKWQYLNDNMTLLAKKRSLIKASVQKMIKQACTYVEQTPSMETKIALIVCLREITDGKIYVELERARLTLKLAHIRENQNKVKEAATVLQDLQVETFGSMDRKEKIEFILEQMRLCILNKDIIRAQIISKKISTKYFTDNPDKIETQQLKLKYYRLMVLLKTKEENRTDNYLAVSTYYQHMLSSNMVTENVEERIKATKAVLLYCLLAEHAPDQVSLLNQTFSSTTIEDDLPQYRRLAKMFLDQELIRWKMLCEMYQVELCGKAEERARMDIESEPLDAGSCQTVGDLKVFIDDATWETFKQRVVEHNLRVVSKYYSKISTDRLSQLLDLDEDTIEDHISRLVVKEMIYAKVDRLSSMINFRKAPEPRNILNDWGDQLDTLMHLVNETSHLISKEYMLANAKIGGKAKA